MNTNDIYTFLQEMNRNLLKSIELQEEIAKNTTKGKRTSNKQAPEPITSTSEDSPVNVPVGPAIPTPAPVTIPMQTAPVAPPDAAPPAPVAIAPLPAVPVVPMPLTPVAPVEAPVTIPDPISEPEPVPPAAGPFDTLPIHGQVVALAVQDATKKNPALSMTQIITEITAACGGKGMVDFKQEEFNKAYPICQRYGIDLNSTNPAIAHLFSQGS